MAKWAVYLNPGRNGSVTIIEAEFASIKDGCLKFYVTKDGRNDWLKNALAPTCWGGMNEVTDEEAERIEEAIGQDEHHAHSAEDQDGTEFERADHWSLADCKDPGGGHVHLVLHREDDSVICEASLQLEQLEEIVEVARGERPIDGDGAPGGKVRAH
jgi:hypothetical protein